MCAEIITIIANFYCAIDKLDQENRNMQNIPVWRGFCDVIRFHSGVSLNWGEAAYPFSRSNQPMSQQKNYTKQHVKKGTGLEMKYHT